MATSDPRRPNVLYVVSDDQGSWALGCAGNPEIKTPVLDRLAAGGIRFENFFCVQVRKRHLRGWDQVERRRIRRVVALGFE